MTWDERQRRMLEAMGVRLFAPLPVAALAPAAAVEPAVAVAGPAVGTSSPAGGGRPSAPARPPAMSPTPAPVAAPTGPAAAAPAALDTALAGRAAGIAAMDWPALREAVSGCTACGLRGTCRQTVFGVGHAQADWMVIGEAPGEQEDIAGEPFVGPAGQLLDQMLRAVGQSRRAPAMGDAPATADDQAGDPRRRVFIANTLKCRPPRNRNPEPGELAACEPFLRRQVELVKPRLILALGRFAVKSLLDSDEAIGRMRGRLHRYQDIPVVVSYHPAYLLRNMPDKAKAWEDLCLAARTFDAAA